MDVKGSSRLVGRLLSTRHKTHIVVLFVCLMVYFGGIAWLAFSPPAILSTASVLTERVSIEVEDGTRAAFAVSGMRIGAPGLAINAQCVTGLIRPAEGTTVVYGRVGGGPLTIQLFRTIKADSALSKVGYLLQPNGSVLALDGSVYLEADATACAKASTSQVPIWGQVVIGLEFRPAASDASPEPTFLLSGSLRVMARSIAPGAPKLYPVIDMTLPVGSRLEAFSRASHAHSPVWWGIAYVDPQRPALVLEVASDARELALYRPDVSAPDRIAVSGLQQLFADPFIIWIQLILGSAFALGAFAGFLANWRHSDGKVSA